MTKKSAQEIAIWHRRRRWLLRACLLIIAILSVSYGYLMPIDLWFGSFSDYVQQRRQSIDPSQVSIRTDDSHIEWVDIGAAGTSTLKIAIMPARIHSSRLVFLLGGLTKGRSAIELIPQQDEMTFVAVDYPYFGDIDLHGLDYLTNLRQLISALHDVVPALCAAVDYMETRPDLNADQIELVGVSLGAVLVCAAGALDDRFDRVWCVHGGADVPLLLRSAGHRVRPKFIRESLVQASSLLVRHLDPGRYVADISPRQFVLIGASEDELIPRASVDLLFDLAAEPKTMIWLDSQHVNSRRPDVVTELVDEVIGRILSTD